LDIKDIDMPQKLELLDRKRFAVNGVTNVEHFTTNEVVLKTTKGGLKISGKNFNLEDLSKQNTNIVVTGYVEQLQFVEIKEKRSFFKDLFR